MSHEQYKLDREVRATMELKKSLSDAFEGDPELMADTIEGETGLEGAILSVMESIDEDQLLVDGLGVRIPELTDRLARIKKRIETKKTDILQAFVISERNTAIEAPLFTLSKRKTAPSMIVTEEESIPTIYWKPQDPKLDKKALKSDLKGLKDGESIPGATLDNGGVSLIIRRK